MEMEDNEIKNNEIKNNEINPTEQNETEQNTSEQSLPEQSTTEQSTTEQENSEQSKTEPVKTEQTDVSQNFDYDESGEFKWYAVRIISGHENKVKVYLNSQIHTEKYEDRIRNVVIPLEKVFEVKGGKKKTKYKNFLPGYILIEAKLDDKMRSFISQAPSILNMVGAKSIKGQRLEPIPLRETELKRLKSILNEDSQSEKIDFQLSIGDPVKVTSGPFNNFSGNVFEINTEKMKVKVMVSIFGRKTPIELEFTQVEKEK
jgi:transcription termination/antitermination protein NusG